MNIFNTCPHLRGKFFLCSIVFIFLLNFLFTTATPDNFFSPIQTEASAFVFKPPRPLYFAPLQLTRKVSGAPGESTRVSFLPVNVLDAERQFLQQGFISYFGALKIAQDTAKRVFILQTTAVYCSATLSMSGVDPITTTMVLTPDIRTLSLQETKDLMGFKHSPPFGDTIKMFFYESEFQKTFDTVPVGTEIFISCPPQISFTALTKKTMVDPQESITTTIYFYNFATTPTPIDRQIYPIASTSTNGYSVTTNSQNYPSTPLFSSPEVSFVDTQPTSIDPLNTITWTFTPPFLTYDSNYQNYDLLPPPVNVFQFFTGIFSTKHITQMLVKQYGLIGIPCRTLNGVTVGYVQPGIVVRNTVQYSALQLVGSSNSYATGKSDFSGFSHIFATESCTFQISLPRSLILDVPTSNWDQVSGIYGVNGIPIISKLPSQESYFMRLSSNLFYHMADTKFSDLGSTLPSPVSPNAPSIEVLGTTFLGQTKNLYDTLILPGPYNQRLVSPSVTAKVVDLTISGLFYSATSTNRPHFCFWNSEAVPTQSIIPTNLLNSCFSDVSLVGTSNLMIPSYPLNPNFPSNYSCLTPSLTPVEDKYQTFRCLIQIPPGSRMSIHWTPAISTFPVSKFGSTFSYTNSVPFRIVQVDGKYFTTTEGQFFDGNDCPTSTLFSALPSPSEQLLFDTAISSQVTQPDKLILSNSWKYSYRVSFSSLQYYSAGARAVIRISVNDLQDMTSLYAFSDAKLETFTSTPVSLGVLEDPQIVKVGQVAFLIFNSVDPDTKVLTLTIPLIWNSTPLSNLPPLNNPFTFDQYRFNLYYDYLCFLTSFNAMTLSNAPNVSFFLLRPNDGTGVTYNMVRTDVLPPSPLWYSQFYKTIATSQLDLQKFPALLFHHIQLHLSNQCAEYGLTQSPQNTSGMIAAMDLCRTDIFLDMTLPSYGSAGDQRPLPTPTSLLTTTPHSVNSIQLSSSQTPGPQFASIAHHPAVVFFKLHLGIKKSSPLKSFASFTNNWFEAIRTTFARVVTSTETIKEYQVFPDFSAAPTTFLHIAPRATTFMTPESDAIADSAIFNDIFIPEPSVRTPDGSFRLLKPGEIVRFQVNWRKYIVSAHPDHVTALRSDGNNPINAFTLIGAFDDAKSLIIPLTVSKIRHIIGFPYSFTIPEFDLSLTFIAIIPRRGVDRPTSLHNIFIENDTTITWIKLADFICIDPNPIPPTWATLPTWAINNFVSPLNPAYVVALSNPLNASPLLVDSPLRQLMYHKAMIALAASSWHWYRGLSSPYSLNFPKNQHTNFAYSFDGPAIDFRRFAISPLSIDETTLQGFSPFQTASQSYIIYQNPSPFYFSQDLLGYVFEDRYLPVDDEDPFFADMCPSSLSYCIDPISVSAHKSAFTDSGYPLYQIDPPPFTSDYTINLTYLKITTTNPSLKPTPPMVFTPFDYNRLTRQLSVSWSYPLTWFSTFTSRTIYFRAKLTYNLPQEESIWITASYTIDNQYTTQTSPKTMTDYFIPDFVTTAQFNIPPLPSLSGSLIITLVPVNLPSGTVPFNTEISFGRTGIEVSSVCESCDSGCNDCCLGNKNDYQPSGCNAILDGYTAAGTCTELVGKKCPIYMILDFTTCSCQCTTSTCRQNTRGAMLYFNQADDEVFTQYIEPRSKSYISRSLHSDFSIMLGLNKLPLPPSTTPGSPKSQRGFLDQYLIGSATPHVPPVGYEELVLLPITYSTLNPAQILAYISIKPFSGMPQTTQFATALANRFKYLESRFQYILTYANTLSTPDDPILFHPLSVSTTESNNGKFIDLSSRFSPTTPNTPKLTTRCIQFSNTQPFTFSCPAPSTITSPFWSQCPSADPNAHRELSI